MKSAVKNLSSLPNGFTFSLKPLALSIALAFSTSTHAATFIVKNTNDSGIGSLRQAINSANASPGHDEIIFFIPPEANPLPSNPTIKLTSGELSVTDSLTIIGPVVNDPAGLTLDAGGKSRLIKAISDDFSISKLLTLRNLTLTNGKTLEEIDENGGAVFSSGLNVQLVHTVVSGNSTGHPFSNGGGLYVQSGKLTLNQSTVSGNSTVRSGGGIFSGGDVILQKSTVSGNSADSGGGLNVIGSNLTINQSTISGNSAKSGGGIGFITAYYNGCKGIMFCTPYLDYDITINQSTISGNSASYGGGLSIGVNYDDNVNITLNQSTVVKNTSGSGAGGLDVGVFDYSSSLKLFTLKNSILSNNNGPQGNFYTNDSTDPNNSNNFTNPLNVTNTLFGDSTSEIKGTNSNNIFSNSPGLGPLQDNGGPTLTHNPNPGSPVLDAGSNTSSFSYDQRGEGFTRIHNGAVDIGSVENQETMTLVGMEVVQVVQDLENSVPLIEKKNTLVRAFLEPESGTPSVKATAKLYGTKNGIDLPGSPLSPNYTGVSITAKPDALARRGEIRDSLNFKLPDSWLEGTVELELKGSGAALDCKDAALSLPNECKTTVTFNAGSELEVKFFKVKYKNGIDNIEPDDSDLNTLEKRLLAIAPVKSIDRTTGTLDMGKATSLSAYNVNVLLETMRILDSCGLVCNRRYLGVLDQNGRYNKPRLLGRANGVPGSVSTSRIFDGNEKGRYSFFHEIGHNLGRTHAKACHKNPPQVFDFRFTYPLAGELRATIGPMDQGNNKLVYGWDSSLRNIVVDPNKKFELMSYCPGDRWISSVTYGQLIQKIKSEFGAASKQVAYKAGDKTYQIYRAIIDPVTRKAETKPIITLTTDNVVPETPPGEYELVLKDALGNEIQRISFKAIEMHPDIDIDIGDSGSDIPDPAEDKQLMLVTVEKNPDVKSFEIISTTTSTVLGGATANNNLPNVRVTSPNGGEQLTTDNATISWVGSDLDSDALSYTIQYSPDGGNTWETLQTDYQENDLSIDLNQFSQSLNALVKVQVSDGFNTAEDVSDAEFSIPNSSPQCQVNTPRNNQVYGLGQPIAFDASSHDMEDSDVVLVHWSSDLDSTLGTGNDFRIIADNLTEGKHLISVVCTDSAGLSATDSVTIEVKRILNPPQPPVAVDDNYVTDKNMVLKTGDVLLNDFDTDSNTLSVSAADVTSTQGGAVVNNDDGTFIYTPKSGFIGVDTFTYTVSDDDGGTDSGTVSIIVNDETSWVVDIDGDSKAKPLTDGLLVLRYLFGFTDDALISNAVESSATRTTANDIQAYLQTGVENGALDIDGNSEVKPLTDGLLVLRYLFGFTGDSLVNNAIGDNATRTTAIDVEAYLLSKLP